MAKYLWLEKEKSDRSRARDINTIKICGYGNFNSFLGGSREKQRQWPVFCCGDTTGANWGGQSGGYQSGG
jgi:hypothetical protein